MISGRESRNPADGRRALVFSSEESERKMHFGRTALRPAGGPRAFTAASRIHDARARRKRVVAFSIPGRLRETRLKNDRRN